MRSYAKLWTALLSRIPRLGAGRTAIMVVV